MLPFSPTIRVDLFQARSLWHGAHATPRCRQARAGTRRSIALAGALRYRAAHAVPVWSCGGDSQERNTGLRTVSFSEREGRSCNSAASVWGACSLTRGVARRLLGRLHVLGSLSRSSQRYSISPLRVQAGSMKSSMTDAVPCSSWSAAQHAPTPTRLCPMTWRT
jgi:hypothetical protein